MTSPSNPGPLTPPTLPNLPAWLRELYPFATRTALINAQRMSFVELGSPLAPPVILLHGNPTWSVLWRTLIPRLAQRYLVIAPDMIGFGLSDKPTEAAYHTIPRHSANLAALVDALAAENSAFRAQKIMLVMHDWAGPIGLDYAANNPQKIRKLVLVNSWLAPVSDLASVSASASTSGSPAGHVKLRPASRLSIAGALGGWLDSALNFAIPAAINTTGRLGLPANVLDAYKFPFRDNQRIAPRVFFKMTGKAGSASAADSAAAAQLREGLRCMDAPAEILWGAKDPVCGQMAAQGLREAIPNAREPLALEYHGHMLPEETPEALLTRILEEIKPQSVLRILQ